MMDAPVPDTTVPKEADVRPEAPAQISTAIGERLA